MVQGLDWTLLTRQKRDGGDSSSLVLDSTPAAFQFWWAVFSMASGSFIFFERKATIKCCPQHLFPAARTFAWMS